MKRIAISTGGGDAPGLNAVIRGATLTSIRRYGWEVVGIRNGFDGIMADEPLIPLTVERVEDILQDGGTILGAANRGNPFEKPISQPDGSIEYEDVSGTVVERIRAAEIDALIMVGGDGTMHIANGLQQKGLKIVGVPKTIDNDLTGTDRTFGFDSALSVATDALDRLRTTAESHHRVMVLEVMGRHAGWIALHAGVAGGADVILLPEIPFDINIVCQKVRQVRESGRLHSLIVVAEGAAPAGGEQLFYIQGDGKDEGRLGGMAHWVGAQVSHITQAETRVTVLGHIQRGGSPTVLDRWLGTRFGANAAHLVAQEHWGEMVALRGNDIVTVPIAQAVEALNQVAPDGEPIRTARDIGISFGAPEDRIS
ncbi:MAG: 6-phosphofructokinase [Anaerolineales bacterium]